MTQDGSSKFSRVAAAAKGPAESAMDAAKTGKVWIGSIDMPTLNVQAQFNPKELDISRSVPWSKTNEANKSNAKGGTGGGEGQGIHLEFTGAEGRALSLELLFDGYEMGPAGIGFVSKAVKTLEELASVRVPGSKKEEEKRPHRCIAVWGSALPGFKCVIESLSTKYTMFDAGGNPLRATCTVKLKEADVVSVAKKK